MRLGLSLAFCFLAALAAAQTPAPAAAPAKPARTGYLSSAQMPDIVRIVPAAPSPGDSRDAADQAIFRATRSLEGSPRWTLARADDDFTAAGVLKALSCALGASVTNTTAPLTTALIARVNVDTTAAATVLKDKYQRKRPFQVAEGNICIPRTAALERSPDYPSGHATIGWGAGLVLAELAPDAASNILARARAYGESRVVCGAHNLTAVEAGWSVASVVIAAVHGSTAFRADADAARAELAALRGASTATLQGCALEADTLSKKPF
ncbi:MAG: phosphatase PAP2 family protein [Acidobacteriota bacterium]